MLHFTLTTTFGYLTLLTIVLAETHRLYIIPTSNGTCPNNNATQCLTLSEYAQQSLDTASNSKLITLSFAPGNHHLDSDLRVMNVMSLILQGAYLNKSSLPVVTITCFDSGFTFENISTVSISGLEFNGCKENAVRVVTQFKLEGCTFHTGNGIELERVGNATIVRSSFVSLSGKETQISQTENVLTGSAVATKNSFVVINESQFDWNMATIGGSIHSQNSDIKINMSDFTYNVADNGGAIFADTGTNITIYDIAFVNNTAAEAGGALFLRANSSIVIDKCQFEGNTANTIGSSINTISNDIEINMSKFTNNAASIGGTIFINSANITMHNNVFVNNVAGSSGGAIVVSSSTMMIEKCQFEGNMAGATAGSIISWNSNIKINTSTFTNNAAVMETSGAICAASGTNITMHDNVFINNRARAGGALIIINPKTSIVIDKCQFVENVADDAGGSIYAQDGKIEINMSKFNKNSAGNEGGAIRTSFDSNIIIHDSTFVNNTAYSAGSIFAEDSNIEINMSNFNENSAGNEGGAIQASVASNITIYDSTFVSNTAYNSHGGVIIATSGSNITIHDSTFLSNRAASRSRGGGVIAAIDSIVLINKCHLDGNAAYIGGSIYSTNTHIEIYMSNFNSNVVDGDGGIIAAVSGTNMTIFDGTFTNNSANNAGVIGISSGTVIIERSIFTNNRADDRGGVIDAGRVTNVTTVLIKQCQFNGNMAGHGGSIFSENSHVEINMSNFTNSAVEGDGGVIAASSSTIFIHNGMFMNSTAGFGGVIYIDNGNIFIYDSTFINGTANKYTSSILALHNLQEGPVALTCFQGDIPITEKVITSTDQISNGLGGAIMAANSKIHAYGDTTIANNMAALSGGGIYAYQTELNFQGVVKIAENTATEKGGGIYAVNTSVKLTGGKLQLTKNKAERGGGLNLELNAKLNIIKSEEECLEIIIPDCTNTSETTRLRLQFINNTADYGGALYISDDTNTGTCAGDTDQSTASECFIQGLGLHSVNNEALNIRNTHFTGNSATKSGGSIFGGLLDRCKVNPNAEVFNKFQNLSPSSLNATTYLIEITDLTAHDIQSEISSEPVRICTCKNGLPDCNYSLPTYQVMKGQTILVSLAAVDQVQNPVPAEVTAVLASRDGRLGVRQDIQNTTSVCTKLNYTVSSPRNSEQLILYAKGPCTDIGISKIQINVEYLPCNCPIGFVIDAEISQTDCICVCDPRIYPSHIASCSIDNESVQRKDNKWINYINSSNQDSYLIHPHCPFDYCQPLDEEVWINLNVPKGADVQCSFNRSGKLCGACEDGLSLSIGSSHCMPCSNNWLTLLIVFAIAGIVLVAFILKCNLTVAVGTINGLIFYANVIAANRAIFLPFDKPNVLTIFISWLNLDFGFGTCFYDGMDGYAQTWLQLAFPLYIISMVVAIIVISDHSSKFGALFRTKGKDPVATLATLILLSYAKLIRTIIASLSFTTIEYTDGSHELVWLTDANVPYLKGKHIPLFLTAIVIVIVGLTYTILLFGWQWLVHPKIKPLAWITKNGKVFIFMDTYHNPYNKDHRYWIGLLLFVRAILFIISAVNVLGDPHINLLSINSAVVILFFIQIFPGHKITKSKLILTIENISYLNLIGFTYATYYITADRESRYVVAYISTTIMFIMFLAVLIYHTCMFALNKQYEKVKSLFKSLHRDSHTPANQTPPDTTNRDILIEAAGVTIVDHPEMHDTLSDDYEQSETESDNENETSNERDTMPDNKETLDYCFHTDTPSGCSEVVTRPAEDAHNLACNVKFIDTEIPSPVSRNAESIEMSTVVICYENEKDDCNMDK